MKCLLAASVLLYFAGALVWSSPVQEEAVKASAICRHLCDNCGGVGIMKEDVCVCKLQHQGPSTKLCLQKAQAHAKFIDLSWIVEETVSPMNSLREAGQPTLEGSPKNILEVLRVTEKALPERDSGDVFEMSDSLREMSAPLQPPFALQTLDSAAREAVNMAEDQVEAMKRESRSPCRRRHPRSPQTNGEFAQFGNHGTPGYGYEYGYRPFNIPIGNTNTIFENDMGDSDERLEVEVDVTDGDGLQIDHKYIFIDNDGEEHPYRPYARPVPGSNFFGNRRPWEGSEENYNGGGRTNQNIDWDGESNGNRGWDYGTGSMASGPSREDSNLNNWGNNIGYGDRSRDYANGITGMPMSPGQGYYGQYTALPYSKQILMISP